MTEKIKRRAFLARTLAGAAGGLLIGFPQKLDAKIWQEKNDGMVLIPEGDFLMGTTRKQAADLASAHGYHESWILSEVPQKEINLSSFWIDRYPVTNEQYYKFCRETGSNPPVHWKSARPAAALQNPAMTFTNLVCCRRERPPTARTQPEEAA